MSVKAALALLAAAQLAIPLGKPRLIEQPRAPIGSAGPSWAVACDKSDDPNKPAPPVRIHANTYLVGTCGLSSILIVGDQGNTGTEDLVAVLSELGIETAIDPHRLMLAGRLAEEITGRPLFSRVQRSGLAADVGRKSA